MESGERCWAAEVMLRGAGLVLLAACVGGALLLHAAVHARPPHEPQPREIAEAILVVAGWSLGGLLLTTGAGLFRLVDLPGCPAPFEPDEDPDR